MDDKVMVIWVSREVESATHMAAMYSRNSKLRGWWKNVDFVIWGPSAQTAAESPVIQEEIKLLQHAGVNVRACISCSDKYGVTEKLRSMDIDVRPMGAVLTEELQNGTKVLTV